MDSTNHRGLTQRHELAESRMLGNGHVRLYVPPTVMLTTGLRISGLPCAVGVCRIGCST